MLPMAWAVFLREVNFRMPKTKVSFQAKPGPQPQQWRRAFVDYAVGLGAAWEVVPPPNREQARALKAKEQDNGQGNH